MAERKERPADPASMSLEELERELRDLVEHEERLSSLPPCRRDRCDGRPHQGAWYAHDPRTKVGADPIEEARMLDAGYRVRDHLAYMSERLAKAVEDVENGISRKLKISMPPRMGKSYQVSTYTPTWLIHKHPEWRIGLISHSSDLAVGWGRQVRRMVEDNYDLLGVEIAPDAGAVANWETTAGGAVRSRSVGQSIIGHGFKVMIIDDPVKGFAEAHSEHERERLWNWFSTDATSRLEPPSLVIVVGCLTAETPVLMADGQEKRIDQVRPGDDVVTYRQDGQLAVGRVKNSANVGADHVYTISLESGRVIRANARHPFLTMHDDGSAQWRRTDELRAGSLIAATAERTGASGVASHARQTDASFLRSAEGSAPRTTTRLDGLRGRGGELASRIDALTSGTDTAWMWSTTMNCWLPRAASALSASASQTSRTPEVEGSCSLTTATTHSESGGCSVTTATSSSGTVPTSNGWSAPSATSPLTTDRVVSVEITGYEDVFDIEVDGTHTFIANGLVTHNTRWHEDDMIGRLDNPEYGDPSEWETIRFPAIAEENDVLGRAPGDPLYSPLIPNETREQALERWEKLRRAVGSYSWASMFQQRPAPAEGAIFNMGAWRYWTSNPSNAKEDGSVVYLDPERDLAGARWLDSWDMSYKGSDNSDYVVGQRWARKGPNRYLIAQTRGRRGFTETLAELRRWRAPDPNPVTNPYGNFVHETVIEEAANGTAIMDAIKNEIAGVLGENPVGSKEARARAVTPEVESRHVYLPYPGDEGNGWVTKDLLPELREFPHGAHDDQVDALTQALRRLHDQGKAKATVPRGTYRRGSPLSGRYGGAATARIPGR